MKSKVVLTVCLMLVASELGGCASSQQSGKVSREHPPNIVLIMADDLGYGDLGSYGQEIIQTPHLDRMADHGMRFTQFYAGSTVCAPSRSVLLTGEHTGHTPIRGNKEVYPVGEAPLPRESKTIAEVLQKDGYRTGAFGKWGLGAPGSEGMPTEQGFDTFFGYLGQRRAHFYYPNFLYAASKGDSLRRVPLEGNAVKSTKGVLGAGPAKKRSVYSHDRIMDEALQFINNAQRDQPFFAYLPVTIPHAELEAPDDAMDAYTDDTGNSIFEEKPFPGNHYGAQPMPKATYAAMVSRLDRDVGRLLSTLRAQGLSDNTLVLFTSDNGPHEEGGYDPSYFNSNGPLRGRKRDLYDGGIRVPLIAQWPGHVTEDASSDHIGYLGDFMATFADLAGAKIPKFSDSISIEPTLLGHPAQQEKHKYLYWEFAETDPTQQAVRKEHWKAIRKPIGTGQMELYNLRGDPGEKHNVAAQHPDVVAQIASIMQKAHTSH